MCGYLFANFLRIAVLTAGLAAIEVAGASPLLANPGHVRYTTGSGEARSDDRQRFSTEVIADRALSQEIQQWQVASVEVPALSGQSSMIAVRPITPELPTITTFGSGTLRADRGAAVRSTETIKAREPGFWAPTLSTLALALFFFLRRLA